MYIAHATAWAKKNRIPIAPPNSGPSARLIMTAYLLKEITHTMEIMLTSAIYRIKYENK